MVAEKKVIFAGLDQSGKTSIIKSFENKFSFGLTRSTIGINRSNLETTNYLGINFMAWDLGGQVKFREKYFTQKYRIFTNVCTVFYIIDLQNPKRYAESFSYLKDIQITMKELKETPLFIICLHKDDPKIKDQIFWKSNRDILKNSIKSLSSRFQNIILETSIYDFSTIINAFSTGIMRVHPKSQLIQKYMSSFAKMTFSSAIVLLSEDLLQIGSHASQTGYIKTCETVAPRFVIAMEKLREYGVQAGTIIMNIKSQKVSSIAKFDNTNDKSRFVKRNNDNKSNSLQEGIVFLTPIELQENINFYLVSYTKNKRCMKLTLDYLPKFINRLESFLYLIV
ncbi:MAG: ADP-ribosylation factor-like protein [Promethearchaeota archaeon]